MLELVTAAAVDTLTILHVGCGRKQLPPDQLLELHQLRLDDPRPKRVIHLDADANLTPDVVATLGQPLLDIPDNSVDLILAWHVLEHVGRQGETAEWFRCFEEFYRILKPGGLLYGECPYYDSIWAWSDPTHTRVISEDSFVFFNQESYRIPGNIISPYRIACDFAWAELGPLKGFMVLTEHGKPQSRSLRFALGAKKPLRTWWESPTLDLASIGQNGGVQ